MLDDYINRVKRQARDVYVYRAVRAGSRARARRGARRARILQDRCPRLGVGYLTRILADFEQGVYSFLASIVRAELRHRTARLRARTIER